MGRWIVSGFVRWIFCLGDEDFLNEDMMCSGPYEEKVVEAHQMDEPLLSGINVEKVPYHREFPCANHQQISVPCMGRSSCTCGLDRLRDGKLDFNKIGKDFRALCGELSQAQLIDNEAEIAASSAEKEEVYGGEPSQALLMNNGTEIAAYSAEKEEVSRKNIVNQIRTFSNRELRKATNNFHHSRKIADGGYSTVFLGKLKDGHKVAVKVLLDNDPEQQSRFNMEVNIVSRLSHPNLVTLHGCSSPSSRKLVLVYEWQSNGTVASHLHHPETSSEVLPWALRMRIAIEIAEALAYLHNGQGDIPIIHRDLKTENILLDDNFHVKIADFGLSDPFRSDINPVFLPITPASTQGYLDPKYQLDGILTDKSDVYSFGVVLLELLSGKPAVDVERDEVYLFEMALNMIRNKELDHFVQEDIGYHSYPEIKRMMILVAELACMCLQIERTKRPPITKVLTILNSIRDESQQSILLLSPDEEVTLDYQNSWGRNYKFVHLYLQDIGDIDTIKQASRLYGHNLSSIALFYVFKVHNHLVEPFCMCRLLLIGNDIFEGMARSTCFTLLILNYFMVLAAINDTPKECQQNFNKLLARAYMDQK